MCFSPLLAGLWGRSVSLLLEGCAHCVCAGCCVAGAYVDFFSRAGAGAIMVCAVGDIAGNTVVFFAGSAGFFRRIVVHDLLSFQSKNLERHIVLSYFIVCLNRLFYSALSGIYRFGRNLFEACGCMRSIVRVFGRRYIISAVRGSWRRR